MISTPTLDHDAQIQNALARHGAVHLRESSDLVPSDQLDDVGEVVREALLSGSPRLVTALAPVLVRNINRVHPGKLRLDLVQAGLERRIAREAAMTESAPPELLDATISSAKTRRAVAVAVASSAISKSWGLITSLQPEDFVEASRAANAH